MRCPNCRELSSLSQKVGRHYRTECDFNFDGFEASSLQSFSVTKSSFIGQDRHAPEAIPELRSVDHASETEALTQALRQRGHQS